MAPDHLQRVEHVFAVEQMRTKASGTFSQKGMTDRFGVFALRRLITLSCPVNCLIDQRTQGYTYCQMFRLTDLNRVSEWFADWPHGFLKGIQTARASFLSTEPSVRPKTILLAHAFPRIKDVLDFDAKEVRRRSEENNSRTVLAGPSQASPKDIVDIQTLTQMTGCSYKLVLEWIKDGTFGEVVSYVGRNGHQCYEIDGQRARDIGLVFARTSTISRLAKMIGTESNALLRLAHAKVFPIFRVSFGTRLARVPPGFVFEIVSRLIDKTSHNAAVPDSALSFSQAVLGLSQLASQEIREFIDDLGTEVLPLTCRESSPTRLDDVLVSVKDWRNWITVQSQRLKI
jgi:hypothetical protein